MRRQILVTAAMLLLFSCKNTGDGGDHIPPKEMRKILLDVHLAETYSTMAKDSLNKMPGAKNLDSLSRYYKDIFAHYHITKEQFMASMDWYKNNPDELDTMYNELIPVVTGLQAALPKK